MLKHMLLEKVRRPDGSIYDRITRYANVNRPQVFDTYAGAVDAGESMVETPNNGIVDCVVLRIPDGWEKVDA